MKKAKKKWQSPEMGVLAKLREEELALQKCGCSPPPCVPCDSGAICCPYYECRYNSPPSAS